MTSRIQNGEGVESQLAGTLAQQQRMRFDKSYGVMTMVMGYLPRIEQLKFQGLDKWQYDIGVGRVQVRFVWEMFYFTDSIKPWIVVVSETGKFQRFYCRRESHVENHSWISCQVGRFHLFQCTNISFRMLKIDHFQKNYTVEKSGARPESSEVLCMANFKDQFIFLFSHRENPRRYSLARDRWRELPPFQSHPISACSLGDKVYVFASSTTNKNVIHVLHNPGASISSQELHWQVIEVPGGIVKPRQLGVGFVPLNSTEIAILGGSGYGRLFRDVSTFNTSTYEFKKELDGNETDHLGCHQNKSAKICGNTIIALVRDKAKQTRLIKYTKGDTCVTSLQSNKLESIQE